MKKNMGKLDRILRALIALVIVGLYFSGQLTGLAAIILGIMAVAFFITSAIGFCGLYRLLGISTLKKKADETSGQTGGQTPTPTP